jgi:hypothetical protein
MSARLDTTGTNYAEIVRKNTVWALIQTTTSLIHGVVYARPPLRLKDDLNVTGEQFIAVTDAEVYNAAGQVLVRAEFMAVNKAHIIWIRPDEDPDGSDGQAGGGPPQRPQPARK